MGQYRQKLVRRTIAATGVKKVRVSQKISGISFLLSATVMKDNPLLIKANHHTGQNAKSIQIDADVCAKTKSAGESRPLAQLSDAQLRQVCARLFDRLLLDGAQNLKS